MSSVVNELAQRVQRYFNELRDEAEDLTEKTMIKVRTEYSQYQEEAITKIFNDAVTSFYNAYTPHLYVREGDTESKSGGLYDVLEIQRDNDGNILYDSTHNIDDILDGSKMHLGRSGNSLYEKVFVSGWHGGAEGGEKHPHPGTPYYRKPSPWYTTWDYLSPGAVRTTSPYRIIADRLSNENKRFDSEYQHILTKHNDELVKQITEEVMPRLINSIIRRAT